MLASVYVVIGMLGGRLANRPHGRPGFADPDALRYRRPFLHDETIANSEQPTQLFSI